MFTDLKHSQQTENEQITHNSIHLYDYKCQN